MKRERDGERNGERVCVWVRERERERERERRRERESGEVCASLSEKGSINNESQRYS